MSAGGFLKSGGRSGKRDFQTEESKCSVVMWRSERVFRGTQQGLLPGTNTHLTPTLSMAKSFGFVQNCPDFSSGSLTS